MKASTFQTLIVGSLCLAVSGLSGGLYNQYLRWLPMAYNPARDTRNWYTRLMFAQHLANLVPVWGRSTGKSPIRKG